MELNLEPKLLESLTNVLSETFPILARVMSLRSQRLQTPAMLITVANIC